MSKIVVVGSLNADFVIRVGRFPVPGETIVGRDFSVFPGGKGANQAFAIGRLNGQVSMIGQVGNDAQAEWLKQNLASAGVDVTHVAADRTVSSGVATITIDASGQNEIIIIPGANGTFGPSQLERSQPLLARAKCVLLQLEVPLATVEAAARWARESGALVILDPAPACELPDALLQCVDYLTPNETELAILTGAPPGTLSRAEAAYLGAKLRQRGVRKVLVKMGAQGALLLTDSDEAFFPSIPVQAVDSTAAGDAFNGAFAAALSEGQPEVAAARFAVAAAACSVTRPGAQPSMPERRDVETLLAQQGEALIALPNGGTPQKRNSKD